MKRAETFNSGDKSLVTNFMRGIVARTQTKEVGAKVIFKKMIPSEIVDATGKQLLLPNNLTSDILSLTTKYRRQLRQLAGGV